MNAITVRDVAKRYRRPPGDAPRRLRYLHLRNGRQETWALRGVSFDIGFGQTVGLVGGNGSGKSTLLRVIAGITKPTRGIARTAEPVRGLLTLGDTTELLMSGEENAVTAGIIAGLTRRQVEARLPRIAAFAELEDHMDQPLRTYSDGMRTRLAFSVAVHIDPTILLIDEILAVGDLRFQQKCLGRIEELRDSGVTILLTSHVMTHVQRICPRTIWLQNGVVRLDGDTEQVTDSYENMMRKDLPAPEERPDGGLRIGTRRVEITDARLLDTDGEPTKSIIAGAALSVEIEYRAHERVTDAIFSVTLHGDGTGTPVLDVSTDAEGVRIGTLVDEGVLRLDLDRLDLAPGRYHLDIGIYGAEWTEIYDYLWEARALDVEGVAAKGPVAPPRHWTLHER